MKKLLVTFCLAALVGSIGCGKSSDSGSSSASQGPNRLFLAVKSTAPAFTATTSQAPALAKSKISSASISDATMLLAFNMLRDYNYPNDEGKIDMTNIYKVMSEAGRSLDDAESMVSPMSEAADSSLSPYIFSDFLGHTYTSGTATQSDATGYGSSIAYKKSGDDQYMLSSYKWAPDAAQQIGLGVIQTKFNDTTKDISLLFAQTVKYPAGSTMGGANGNYFSTRMRVEGNSETHAFEIKFCMSSMNNTLPSVVGKGISQGEGNYFLMRSGNSYYCIPAGATETTLGTITPTDLANVSSNCAAYKDWVSNPTTTFYDLVTDVPNADLSDFDHGKSGTPVKYLMF